MSLRQSEYRFYEVQRFRSLHIWAVLGCIAVLMWYNFIQQIIPGIPAGSNHAPDGVLVVFWVIFGIGFPALFFVMKLETVVRGDVLSFRFYPVLPNWRKIPVDEISGVVAVNYKPFREYGGWGIRFGRQGIAYTVSGNRGVLVRLRGGDSFLLGSRRPEELEIVLGGGRRKQEHKKEEISLKYI